MLINKNRIIVISLHGQRTLFTASTAQYGKYSYITY